MPLLRQVSNRTGSLYLRQHADNPVDWYLWAEDAFALAIQESKPIFLSIGYSACHWCHVMERESFSDPQTAAILNRHFIAIKVDREERPDVDALYMQAGLLLSGTAGWPLSIFLDDQRMPFFAGSYFPPVERAGLPAFPALLQAVARAYKDDRKGAHETGVRLTAQLSPPQLATSHLSIGLTIKAADRLLSLEDSGQGGFGTAPKFPHPLALDFLLTVGHLTKQKKYAAVAERALIAMAKGAIFDPIEGGFHRYTVDGAWKIPHFEKMLYDNALLARVYLHAYLTTGNPQYRFTCEMTLDYVLARMSVTGGFGASEDADSASGEGQFYRWTKKTLAACLSQDAKMTTLAPFTIEADSGVITQKLSVQELARALDIGQPEAAQRLFAIQRKLRAARNQRPRPTLDTKRVTGWNMLMAQTLIEAGAFFDEQRYMDAAKNSMQGFLDLWAANGSIPHCIYPDGSTTAGLLEDWASTALTCLKMAQNSADEVYLAHGIAIAKALVIQFGPSTNPYGRWLDALPGNDLICPPFMVDDIPTPSGRSLAALLFANLATITGEDHWQTLGEEVCGQLCDAVEQSPLALAGMALSTIALLGERRLVTLPDAGAQSDRLRKCTQSWIDPGLICMSQVLARSLESLPAAVEDASSTTSRESAQVCLGNRCLAPTNDPKQLADQLTTSSPLSG